MESLTRTFNKTGTDEKGGEPQHKKFPYLKISRFCMR